MATDIMAVDERLARLETTVAKGFAEQGAGLNRLEDRVDALNRKLGIAAESLESQVQLVVELIEAQAREMRLATRTMQQEHRADRRLMYAILEDHRVRISKLEKTVRAPKLLKAPRTP